MNRCPYCGSNLVTTSTNEFLRLVSDVGPETETVGFWCWCGLCGKERWESIRRDTKVEVGSYE